jgi:hypothetical protein
MTSLERKNGSLPATGSNGKESLSIKNDDKTEKFPLVNGGDGYLWEVGPEVAETKVGQGTTVIDGKRYLLINPTIDY